MLTKNEIEICNNLFKYINYELRDCIDHEIFIKSTLQDLGRFYFDKSISSFDGANDRLLKSIIKSITRNDDLKSDEDYYLSLCKLIGVKILPKDTFLAAQQEYNKIFVQMYNTVKQKIATEIGTINSTLLTLANNIKSVKSATPSLSLVRDLATDEHILYSYYSQCNELRTRKEMLLFAKQHMTSKLSEFCKLDDQHSIDFAIKTTALKLSQELECDVSYEFSFYRDVLEITKDNLDRPYALFFKVKTYTAIDTLHKNWHYSSYIKSDEERAMELNSAKDKIPSIDELHRQKTSEPHLYLNTLKQFIQEQDVLNSVSKLLEKSVCLRERKEILFKSIELYESSEFAIFNHIIPIQIEGMFGDFLQDCTTFNRFTNMTIYINDVLKNKIQHLQDIQVDIYPEAVEYFMYYFNNIIRNRIAHGNYKAIFNDSVAAEIFSHELLLDMSVLIHMLSRKSETDKMYRFVSGYKKYYTKLIKSEEHPCFGALFNDMIGEKIILNYDSIDKNRPLQVAYWLVNPYYERIYESVGDKTELIELRTQFLSKEFWEYTVDALTDRIENNYGYQSIKMEFLSVINGLFKCNITPEVKTLLGKANAALQKIRQMQIQ